MNQCATDLALESLLVNPIAKQLDSFWSNIKQVNTGCWEWQASIRKDGYAMHRIAKSLVLVHRIMFVISNGRLPSYLVRHTCDNPKCVNPDHLIEGYDQDNIDDKYLHGKGLKKNTKTHCINGHEFTDSTSYISPRGIRSCRICMSASNRASYLKRY